MFINRDFKVVTTEKGKALLTAKDVAKGEVVRLLRGFITPKSKAKPLSVQIEEEVCIDSEGKYLEDFINHSCEPNLKVDFQKFAFIAIKDIKAGEELTYNYNTTEYNIDGFECKCRSKNCVGKVNGFKSLNSLQKKNIEPLLSPFLKRKFENERQAQKAPSQISRAIVYANLFRGVLDPSSILCWVCTDSEVKQANGKIIRDPSLASCSFMSR